MGELVLDIIELLLIKAVVSFFKLIHGLIIIIGLGVGLIAWLGVLGLI